MTWPIAVNVPFAPGVVQTGQVMTLSDRRGAIPTQVQPLVAWPDGSVRWARLDALLPPRGSSELVLVARPAPAPAKALRIEESANGIAVDTGAIAFEIPRAHAAIAENVRSAAGLAPAVATVLTRIIADGAIHGGEAPDSLRITRQGPVHGEIEIRGKLGPDFEYLVRIAVDAGSPFVRILHTYTKTRGRVDSSVERISVDIAFAEPLVGRYSVGRESGKPVAGDIIGGAAVVFAQPDNLSFEAAGEAGEGHLAGWFEVAAKHGAIGLAGRWFWQEYPKAVEIGPKGITYDLWSPRGGTARIGIGSAKTHELVLWLARRGAVGKARARAVAAPLRGFVTPSDLAATKALAGAIDPRASAFDEVLLAGATRYAQRNSREPWDDCGKDRCRGDGTAVPRTGAFGMLNWGDWNFPGIRDTVKGTDAWGNLEYDTTQVLALTHAATGDPAVFDQMSAAARHFMDVDTIHALAARPEWVGMNHPKNPRHFSFGLGGVDIGHTWVEGLLSYYLLTGDARGLESARGIGDYLVRRLRDLLRGNPRQWGWPQVALVALYDVTGERRYLDAAKSYAASAIRAHPAKVGKAWKLGVLADCLSYTHAYAGGADIEAWLRAYAAQVKRKVPSDSRFYPALAYIGRVSGEPGWVDLAARRVGRLDLGNWGKPFTIQGRVGLRIESLRQGQGAVGRLPLRALGDADLLRGVTPAAEEDVEGAGTTIASASAGKGEDAARPGSAR